MRKITIIAFITGCIIILVLLIKRLNRKVLTAYRHASINTVKDFFEIGEMKLRLSECNSTITPLYDGIKVVWDSDTSTRYDVVYSDKHIKKTSCHLLGDGITKVSVEGTSFIVPAKKFFCRIVSEKGRISNEIGYPNVSLKIKAPKLGGYLTPYGSSVAVTIFPVFNCDSMKLLIVGNEYDDELPTEPGTHVLQDVADKFVILSVRYKGGSVTNVLLGNTQNTSANV